MARDDTTHNSVTRKCRWYTRSTNNWGVYGNYIKGCQALILQSGSIHYGSERLCLCVYASACIGACVCVCECDRYKASWFPPSESSTSRQLGHMPAYFPSWNPGSIRRFSRLIVSAWHKWQTVLKDAAHQDSLQSKWAWAVAQCAVWVQTKTRHCVTAHPLHRKNV